MIAKNYIRAAIIVLLAVAGWNCSGSNSPMMPDAGVQIAAFAKQLVETQTTDNNEPAKTEDKNLVDNQDPSSFDPDGSTFPPSFFQ